MDNKEKVKKTVQMAPEVFLKINPDFLNKRLLNNNELNDFAKNYFKLVLKTPIVATSTYAQKNFRKNKATNEIKANLNEYKIKYKIVQTNKTNTDLDKNDVALTKNCLYIISKGSFSEDVFRSVRNSIAHGNFYKTNTGYLFYNVSKIINGEKKIKFFMFLKDLSFLEYLIQTIENKDMYDLGKKVNVKNKS